WIGLIVALDIERLCGCAAEQSAITPHRGQECGHVAYNLRPQGTVVRLEYHPLRTFINGFPQEKQSAAHVDVLQIGVFVPADSASTPDQDLVIEVPDAVDTFWIEAVLKGFADLNSDTHGSAYRLISRGFVHSAFTISACIDTSYVSAGP